MVKALILCQASLQYLKLLNRIEKFSGMKLTISGVEIILVI